METEVEALVPDSRRPTEHLLLVAHLPKLKGVHIQTRGLPVPFRSSSVLSMSVPGTAAWSSDWEEDSASGALPSLTPLLWQSVLCLWLLTFYPTS